MLYGSINVDALNIRFFYFYSKNKKYVDALHSCPNKSSNFYSIVHDVVLFFGGFVVWL